MDTDIAKRDIFLYVGTHITIYLTKIRLELYDWGVYWFPMRNSLSFEDPKLFDDNRRKMSFNNDIDKNVKNVGYSFLQQILSTNEDDDNWNKDQWSSKYSHFL